MKRITIMSNAKINLFFSINHIRFDNFCDITSAIAPINLHDTISFKLEKNINNPTTEINISPSSKFSFNKDNNTILKAIQLFKNYTNICNFSVYIDIEKNIPIGGGFGGGSSNATFTLIAINKLFSTILNKDELINLSQKIGTDCPFFVENSIQLATNKGDKLIPINKSFSENIKNYNCLIFYPNFQISTIDAYNKFKKNFKPTENYNEKIKKILTSKYPEKFLFNSFENQILSEYIDINKLFFELKSKGYFPNITGSGSGCFLLDKNIKNLEKAMNIVKNFTENTFHCEIATII